ncbi:MAG: T9SS type A sorting domain-containing protein [Prevotellaceae bacterium]|jgi:hypothetical protein|nr:T9SS type A sorting domain-containing protein [Prevotellaceae bacterium]
MKKITFIYLLCIVTVTLFVRGFASAALLFPAHEDGQKWQQFENASAPSSKTGAEPVKETNTDTNGNTPESSLNVYVSGNTLYVKNVAEGAVVEIYNVLGSRIQASAAVNGQVEFNDLAKGIYIIRTGKTSKKIVL